MFASVHLDMGKPDEPQPALGVAIRQLREKRGLTQEALAHKAGVTTGTLSLVERGRSNPAWGTVRGIATALGVTVGELATLADSFEKTVGNAKRRSSGAE
jgi:transcriptional regulator with XRE-family HTH domain